MKLLNTGATNAKILKSQNGTQYKIASLTLYPNNVICAGAKAAGCMDLCLKDSGFSEIFESVNNSRKLKTEFYLQDQKAFLEKLRKEIAAWIRKCENENFIAAFRLNTISDIDWVAHDIPQEFSQAFFYDYTKRVKTVETGLANYKKIFSYSGTPQYQNQVKKALAIGCPISVVFKDFVPVGKYFLGREIIDGDKSDIINTTAHNKICGLKLKGNKNKRELSENENLERRFVVHPSQAYDLEMQGAA